MKAIVKKVRVGTSKPEGILENEFTTEMVKFIGKEINVEKEDDEWFVDKNNFAWHINWLSFE